MLYASFRRSWHRLGCSQPLFLSGAHPVQRHLQREPTPGSSIPSRVLSTKAGREANKNSFVQDNMNNAGPMFPRVPLQHGTTTEKKVNPWDAVPPFKHGKKYSTKRLHEWINRSCLLVAKATSRDLILRDPTPKDVIEDFYDVCDGLLNALEKDSVRLFLRFFKKNDVVSWGLMITPQTFNCTILLNALRCAKVALEGKEPELSGLQANPNCINHLGYFPLHEAAERFSVDMINLLFSHGALAHVRTSTDKVNGDLLPLHVAVENTCMHKYLEDNLHSNKNHRDYVYKLIHLLCLPEMKVFLDTTRLLAKHTDNVVDEIWNYVITGKIVQAAVLLLAAQDQIRGSQGDIDGFGIIATRIMKHHYSGILEASEKTFPPEAAGSLFVIICQAGESLESYIQAHSKVPHVEVFERVSSILKDHGFSPPREIVANAELVPYACKTGTDLPENHGSNATKTAARNKAAKKELLRGWDPTYARRCFIPYWRSVLSSRSSVMVYPSYASADPKCPPKKEEVNIWRKILQERAAASKIEDMDAAENA